MSIDEMLKICSKEDLSPNYVVALYLFSYNPSRNKIGKKKDREKAYKYLDDEMLNPNDIGETGLLIWSSETEDWEVIRKVQKWFYKPVDNYAKELWELYPRKLKVGDNEFKSNNLSLSKFSSRYNSKGLNEEQHKLVIDLTKWAIKHDKLKVGMIKFLELEVWKDLLIEMSEHSQKAVATRSNSNMTII